MSPLKSSLFGLAVGVIAYIVVSNVGAMFPSQGDNTMARIDIEVSPTLSPAVTKSVTKLSPAVTNLSPSAKTLSPTLSPAVTNLSPTPTVSVTPRISTPIMPSVSPSMTPTPSVTPRTSVTPNPTPSKTPSPTPTPSASVSPSVSPTPTSSPSVGTSNVVINEIAWAGTSANASDEWIELYNSGTASQELAGWFLCADTEKVASFNSSHVIDSGQYFLMERTDDNTISDIAGDYVGPFSKSLVDSGLLLTLRSGSCADGVVVDEVGPGGWYAGNGSEKASMERISPISVGNDPGNWATWSPGSTGIGTGEDAEGQPINGTPKFKNNVSS